MQQQELLQNFGSVERATDNMGNVSLKARSNCPKTNR